MISRDVARAIFKMVRRDEGQRVETDMSNSENHVHYDYDYHDGSDSADQDQRKDKSSKKKHKKQSKHHHRKDKKRKKRRHKSQSRSNSSERSLSPHGAVPTEATILSPKLFEETNEEKKNEEGKRQKSPDTKIVLEEELVRSVTKDKSSSGMKEETHSNSSPERNRQCTSGRSRSRSRSRSTSRDRIKKTSRNSREASSKRSRSLKSKDRDKRFSRSRSNEDKLSKRSKSRSRSRDRKRNKSRSSSRERNRRRFSRSRSRSRERRKYRHYDRTKKRSQSPRRGKSRRSRSKSNSRRHRNCSPRQNLHSRSQTPDHSRSKQSHSRSHSHSPYRPRRKRSRSRSSSPLYRRRRSPSPYFNRYRSRKSESHSHRSERYSRSRSRDRRLSRHFRHSRSRSQSPRRRDRSRSSSKTKESQPAKLPMKTNVATGLTNTDTEKPVNTSLNSQQSKVAKVSGGKTIAELTEFCKKLTAEKLAQNKRITNSGATDEEEDITVSHPFLVKPAPEIIIPKVILPTKRSTEKDDNKPLQEKFPVSCGDKHREKEMNNEAGNIVQGVDGTIPTAKPTINVFNEQPKEKIDISGMVVKRMEAQRRLDANPNDIEAMLVLQEVQMKMSSWCQSNVKPGQFTGQLVKNLLPKDTLQAGGIQAWARKDMFQNLRPVSEGIGMKLLQKMGWKPGQVIGKRGEGYVEPIAVTVKVDRKGLISQGHEKPGSKRQQVTDVQGKHPVSALSEFCSKRRWGLPDYNLVFDHGPAHSKQFLYKVTVNGVDYQPAVVSGNKKHAKAQAAETALKGLGLLPQNAQV